MHIIKRLLVLLLPLLLISPLARAQIFAEETIPSRYIARIELHTADELMGAPSVSRRAARRRDRAPPSEDDDDDDDDDDDARDGVREREGCGETVRDVLLSTHSREERCARDATRRDATRRERFCARARSNARRGRGGGVGTARSPRRRAVRDARDD